MDHLSFLVVIVCVIVIGILYTQIYARIKFGKVEVEVKADRNRDKKEKPGREPDSSSSKDR